jgi:branched-chain amino acid transport system ATP-binding protein
MSEPLLCIENLNAYYGNVQVLWDIDMTINEGGIVSLVGANAGGKSTIVNCITGLHTDKTGSIIFKGKDISKCPANEIVELGITQVPEGRKLFPAMTVEENLEMGAYSKKAWNDRRETIEEVFSLFPRLRERRKQLANSLSGGEQQMCAIARGMVSKPTIMIIDEMSLGLMPQIVSELFQIIKKIASQGMTVILIEQDTKNSLKTSDYAYVLETGRLVMDGESETLLNDERLVKAYLGM